MGETEKCWSSHLKQQAKNERLRHLITYNDDISKSLKPERLLTPLFHFPLWNGALVKGQVDQPWSRGGLAVEEAQNKRLGHSFLRTLGSRRGKGGRAGSGKDWAFRLRNSVFKCSPLSPPIPSSPLNK